METAHQQTTVEITAVGPPLPEEREDREKHSRDEFVSAGMSKDIEVKRGSSELETLLRVIHADDTSAYPASLAISDKWVRNVYHRALQLESGVARLDFCMRSIHQTYPDMPGTSRKIIVKHIMTSVIRVDFGTSAQFVDQLIYELDSQIEKLIEINRHASDLYTAVASTPCCALL